MKPASRVGSVLWANLRADLGQDMECSGLGEVMLVGALTALSLASWPAPWGSLGLTQNSRAVADEVNPYHVHLRCPELQR